MINNDSSFPSPAVGRFAPSPTGRMHLGNLFTALLSWLSVRKSGEGDLGSMKIATFAENLTREVEAMTKQ